MATTDVYLVLYIQNSKSLAKTETLSAGTSELFPKEKTSKISYYTSHQNVSTKLPPQHFEFYCC